MTPTVSRETLLQRYGDLLWEANKTTNLVSRRMNRSALQDLIDGFALTLQAAGLTSPGGTLADIGSGGGLPGIPIAIAHPGLQVLLCEERRLRIAALEALASALNLPNARVLAGNARDLARNAPLVEGVEVCTAFGVGPAADVLELAIPLLVPGGTAILSIPADPSPSEEASWILSAAMDDVRADVRRDALTRGRSILVLRRTADSVPPPAPPFP